MDKHGVFVGRLCPIHLGHERVIQAMLDQCGVEKSLVLIGSSNTPMSLRHFFSYKDRSAFLAQLFPNVRVMGLPDFPGDDDQWTLALDHMLAGAGMEPTKVTFFGGCDEDLRFFADNRLTVEVNRFDGSSPKISATEVRDALIHERPLEGLLNPAIIKPVEELFRERWERFKRM
jgi:nicotinic acid mononucleotide adenylyltransferase